MLPVQGLYLHEAGRLPEVAVLEGLAGGFLHDYGQHDTAVYGIRSVVIWAINDHSRRTYGSNFAPSETAIIA